MSKCKNVCLCVFTGAVSEPIVKILETEDGVQLHCKVVGTSSGLKLNISLRDSTGTKLTGKELKDTERGGRHILQTTVTKSGNYSCVATQEEIGHQVYTETFVRVPGEFLCVYNFRSKYFYMSLLNFREFTFVILHNLK